MVWLVALVFYVCFVCALYNRSSFRPVRNCREIDMLPCKSGKEKERVLPKLRVGTEENLLKLIQEEKTTSNSRSWIFELGF